jgi:hypothetical protein
VELARKADKQRASASARFVWAIPPASGKHSEGPTWEEAGPSKVLHDLDGHLRAEVGQIRADAHRLLFLDVLPQETLQRPLGQSLSSLAERKVPSFAHPAGVWAVA